MDIKTLTGIGLHETEAIIYLAILTAGRLGLVGIAEATSINRTTLYTHLDSLLKLGYIKKTKLGKRLFYFAESPKILLRKHKQASKEFEKKLPNMLAVFDTAKQTPGVTLYQDKEGLKDLYRVVFENANYIKTIYSPDRYFKVFSSFRDDIFLELAEKNKTEVKSLIITSDLGRKVKEYTDTEQFKYKFLPKGYDPPVNVVLFRGHVALISLEHLFGVLISNELIAQYHDDIFEEKWKSLK